jgi:hypothetical protein
MQKYQASLASLFILTAAVAVWLVVFLITVRVPLWPIPPAFVLPATTGAVHLLLRGRRNAWAWSTLIAGVISIATLFAVAAVTRE